jgi:choline dehydrogenase-like flavoprotein
MSVEYDRITRSSFPDDLELLPKDSVYDGNQMRSSLSDVADYVIIGSGAAGATAALVLADAGFSVIILEEGPWIRTRDFGADVYPAMKSMFREMATNVTIGRPMAPVMQGRCVGGSTTINSAIAWRVPEKIVDRWNADFGLSGSVTNQVLHRHYDELDRLLVVRPVEDDALSKNDSLFAEAALRLGIQAERIRRYDGGCQASASCLTGCRSAKKLSMNVTFIPKALHAGARIYTSTKARRIECRYGRARGVEATFSAPGSPSLLVAARRGVIVAASAVQTPGILRRSGIRLAALGKHFQAHQGTSFPGRFDKNVSMQVGATQGFNSMHFVETGHFKIETLSLPPEMLALRIPGVGPEFTKNLLNYRNTTNWALVVRGEAEGEVKSAFGKDFVQYAPTREDMKKWRHGMRVMCEMMFAAGAKEIWPNVVGLHPMNSPDDLKHWENAPLDPSAYGMMISHLFGSARMGPDARSSVVGLDFQVHGMRGIYVVDSSVFPTSTGVNPQHTIMAMSHLAASRIADRPLPIL